MKVIACSLIVVLVLAGVTSGCRTPPASGSAEGTAKPEVTVSILGEDNVVVGTTKVASGDAGKTLDALGVSKDTLITFNVRGDLSYKFVQTVMSSVNRAGYTRVSVTAIK